MILDAAEEQKSKKYSNTTGELLALEHLIRFFAFCLIERNIVNGQDLSERIEKFIGQLPDEAKDTHYEERLKSFHMRLRKAL